MNREYDVVIIGGGPAGSTAATLLAKAGRRVLVAEKETFPRFHIGESLLPYSMDTFERLGIREELDRRFLPKFGAEMASACGASQKFYFKNGFHLKHTQAYQVRRDEFDKLLLDNARKHGAEVQEATAASVERLDTEGAVVVLQPEGQLPRKVRAKYILDATGRATLLGNHLNLKQGYDHLKKIAVYAHYDGMLRDEGVDATIIRLLRAKDRWFWVIPISDTRTSIGMVMDIAAFKAQKLSPERALEGGISAQPVLMARMKEAVRVNEVRAEGEYSYRNQSLAGDRWMMIGDAAGFIDPIFSTGVFMAVYSAEHAADALHHVLSEPSARPGLFRKYEKRLNKVMNTYLRFVTGWYEPEFFEIISTPNAPLDLPRAVNAVLAGNLASSFSIWWRMQLFYFFVEVQKRITLVPRLTLAPTESKECAVY